MVTRLWCNWDQACSLKRHSLADALLNSDRWRRPLCSTQSRRSRGDAILRAVERLLTATWGLLPGHSMLFIWWDTQTIRAGKYKLWNSSLCIHPSPWHLFALWSKYFQQSQWKIKYLRKRIQRGTMGYQEKRRKNKTLCLPSSLFKTNDEDDDDDDKLWGQRKCKTRILTYSFLYVVYHIKIRTLLTILMLLNYFLQSS